MYNCVRCNKVFRNNYDLIRHQARKFPCKIENHIQVGTEKHLEGLKSTDEVLKSTLKGVEKHICEYCFGNFVNKKCLTRHYNCCKSQDDPIRQLEIESGTVPVLPNNKQECRFCNKVLSRKAILQKHYNSCKQRERYHNDLKKGPVTINNGTINNGTINNVNNITININGQESNNVSIKDTIDELKKIIKLIGNSQPYLTAGSWISAIDTIVRSEPENQNVILTNTKAMSAQVLTSSGWVTSPTDNVLQQTFKQAAVRLYNLEQQFERNLLISKTWSEIGHFAKQGLEYRGLGGSAASGSQIRKIRTGFKVGLACRRVKKC